MRDFLSNIRGEVFIFICRVFRRNIDIGRGLKIYKRIMITGKGRVVIGENCTISGVPGDRWRFVTLNTYSPEAVITIGNNACLFGARISSKFSVAIGNEAFIEDASVTDSDYHSITRERGEPLAESRDKCAVSIGVRVSIGARSIVTKGVRIGDDTVVMPGSIVNKSLPAKCVAMGNPARPCREGS
jgi:acetyltransferase-like isoleucine patch superfamily enzyme